MQFVDDMNKVITLMETLEISCKTIARQMVILNILSNAQVFHITYSGGICMYIVPRGTLLDCTHN